MSNIYDDDFLKLLPKVPNEEQLAAIRAQKNSVIAAGAGSGKTQVLAYRFAWLVLTQNAKADEILTLTFTNKAASEMYQRIYQTLVFFANRNELDNKKKNLAQEALKDFANAHIKTLDSYCSQVLRQCANRYGIRPDFSVGSADGSRTIKTQAFKFILKNAEKTAIKNFVESGKLQDFAENTFAKIILTNTSLATEEGWFSKNFKIQKEIITDCWNFITSYIDKPNLNFRVATNVRSIPTRFLELFTVASESKKSGATIEAIFKLKKEFDSIDFSIFKTLELESINEAILTEVENLLNNSTGYRNALTETKEVTNALRNDIPYYLSIISFIRNLKNLESFYELLDDFLAQVNDNKRISGSLSFKDVNEMALKVLLENEDIRNQEKNTYKKIMIDEFQDNNGSNRDLLYLLALKKGEFEDNGKCVIKTSATNPLISQIIIKDSKGNITEDKRDKEKLFFVGDEKQSIYKFRGAEVSVFNELTAKGENETLAMNCNFRSQVALIANFNKLFSSGQGIFLGKDETTAKLDYEAFYQRPALKYGLKELPLLTAENIPIHICLVNSKALSDLSYDPKQNLLPEKEQIAYNMAKKIYELSEGKSNWNDFAILDRTRTDRKIISKYLNLFNIPYNLDVNNDIFQESIVNDFYNFLRLCVYPSNINAYATYLCSPLAGLNENSVEKILSVLIQDDDDFVFDAELTSSALNEILTEKELKKFSSAINFYKESQKNILKQTITTTLTELWHKKGYKYETYLDKNVNLLAEQFDMLFELSRTADQNQKSVSWFIDELDKLRSDFNTSDADIDAKEIAYPLEKEKAVNIMTIHKSKGLQFKHVFVWGCTKVEPKKSGYDYLENETGFSYCPPKGSNFFSLRTKNLLIKTEIAEYRRLIYVAVTRAEQDVYIIGSWNPFKITSENEYRLFENIAAKYYATYFDQNIPNEPQKILYETNAPFDFENIQFISYNDISQINKKNSADSIRTKKIKNSENKYQTANLIDFTCNAIPHSTPSGLEDSDSQIELKRLESKNSGAQTFLEKLNFSAADFGTLAHAYLEGMVNGIAPENFEPTDSYFKNLGKKEIQNQKDLCISFTNNFIKSQFGSELAECKKREDFYRAEWKFKMFHENTIFTGSIDLIYSLGNGSYRIIDYKTDSEICPQKYIAQQNCYRTAASKMLGVPETQIDCKLYFLRYDKAVTIEK